MKILDYIKKWIEHSQEPDVGVLEGMFYIPKKEPAIKSNEIIEKEMWR